MATAKGGKKGRKIGRNKICCATYRAENRREKNRIRRIKRHVRKYPNDTQARNCLR